MKICNICHKISATEQDHIDCTQKRRIELEDDEFRNRLPERLDLANNSQDLGIEVRAILEYLVKEKDNTKEKSV